MTTTSPTISIDLKTFHLNSMGPVETDKAPWGWHLVLNLYDCKPESIQSSDTIKKYIVDLCELIEMRRYDKPVVVNFGDDPSVTGYSMFQLIETSNLAGHFANQSSTAYLDIFSCKEYNPWVAAEFSAQVFGASAAQGMFIHRD